MLVSTGLHRGVSTARLGGCRGEIRQICGKQCGHERVWLIYRKMSERCGINCGKVACRVSACLSAEWLRWREGGVREMW
jgi:hypothetical protein